MIKWFSQGNLKQFANHHNETLAALSSAVASTFEEVYDNLEAIDKCVGGFSYSEADRTLTVPAENGTVADNTLILK